MIIILDSGRCILGETVFLDSNDFKSVDKSEINGVMRECICVTNRDKIFNIDSLLKLFELLEVVSAYVLALDFSLCRVCVDRGSTVSIKTTFKGTNDGTVGVV
jgi:hypothetical protein